MKKMLLCSVDNNAISMPTSKPQMRVSGGVLHAMNLCIACTPDKNCANFAQLTIWSAIYTV